ncbi:MAG: putative glutathione S-transferase-related transrane protein [Betaproteobacteria bacterium]|nr:putative glutathione S-transferase-related transrane protein [Betaproteobacteria bacterium]
MSSKTFKPDPKLDLVLERVVDVPRELVWRAWTECEHLKKWFTPAPWQTVDCEIDLRPGGIFRTVMRSPEGQDFPNLGCYLEVIKNEKLAWTNALGPGFRPMASPETTHCGTFMFTAMIMLEAQGKSTKYTAVAMHQNEAGRKQHADMGFQDGWGAALNQLVAHAKTM